MEIGALITGMSAGEISASAILAIVFLMIMFGKLVPERYYKRQSDLADKWEQAHNREVDMRIQLMNDMSSLIDQGEVQKKISSAIIDNIPTGEDEIVEDKKKHGKNPHVENEEEDEGGA